VELLFKVWSLTGAERDDAADRVVGRHADRDAIARNDLDPKTTHTAAQLGQHFMSGIALHTVEPAGVHRDDGALHVD